MQPGMMVVRRHSAQYLPLVVAAVEVLMPKTDGLAELVVAATVPKDLLVLEQSTRDITVEPVQVVLAVAVAVMVA
jgi:hypothetical protein